MVNGKKLFAIACVAKGITLSLLFFIVVYFMLGLLLGFFAASVLIFLPQFILIFPIVLIIYIIETALLVFGAYLTTEEIKDVSLDKFVLIYPITFGIIIFGLLWVMLINIDLFTNIINYFIDPMANIHLTPIYNYFLYSANENTHWGLEILMFGFILEFFAWKKMSEFYAKYEEKWAKSGSRWSMGMGISKLMMYFPIVDFFMPLLYVLCYFKIGKAVSAIDPNTEPKETPLPPQYQQKIDSVQKPQPAPFNITSVEEVTFQKPSFEYCPKCSSLKIKGKTHCIQCGCEF